MNPILVANWKMNPQSAKEAEQIMKGVAEGIESVKGVDIVICPPFLFLSDLLPYTQTHLSLGAQNIFWEDEGAFTGEISPVMLKRAGCDFVILGHSERKKHLGETLEMTRKKLEAAVRSQLRPILCAESAEELKEILKNADKNIASFLIAVYEPSRAISSHGKENAEPPDLAKKEIDAMRTILTEVFDKDIPVLYGGSVNDTNTRSFLAEAGADGVLVGYASLDPATFSALVKSASLR